MNCTVLLSVVPATMCTGEVTVAFAVGVQMVTEGETVLRVHARLTAEKQTRLERTRRSLQRCRILPIPGLSSRRSIYYLVNSEANQQPLATEQRTPGSRASGLLDAESRYPLVE